VSADRVEESTGPLNQSMGLRARGEDKERGRQGDKEKKTASDVSRETSPCLPLSVSPPLLVSSRVPPYNDRRLSIPGVQ